MTIQDSILVMDAAGKIVWANRPAERIARIKPGGLRGRSYFEFTPPDTHAELLKLHQRKLAGETVRFRIDLGPAGVLSTTSGPVLVGGRVYLFAVGRLAEGPPAGDEILLGLLAAGELLKEKRSRIDLNAILIGALKDEARNLKGKLSLVPGPSPAVLVRPWPIRMVLRRILLQARKTPGRAEVTTGGDKRRSWVRISLARTPESRVAELTACRKIAREQGGRLDVRGRVFRLSLPSA
jgi:PAS domain-containing protein